MASLTRDDVLSCESLGIPLCVFYPEECLVIPSQPRFLYSPLVPPPLHFSPTDSPSPSLFSSPSPSLPRDYLPSFPAFIQTGVLAHSLPNVLRGVGVGGVGSRNNKREGWQTGNTGCRAATYQMWPNVAGT